MASSSIVPCEKYQVFISFRGEDTRDNFTSHLHAALRRNKVKTFIDDSLNRGEQISAALQEAIEESKISVIIFSKNYASSSWCLDELVHILDCKKRLGWFVLPVFYHINPSNVRKQKGSYADGLTKLGQHFNEEKVREWRVALTEAANLSGFSSAKIRPESELVEKIVKNIFMKLSRESTFDLKGLVGIEERVEEIESLFQRSSSKNVSIFGVWGMGGIGKTTLADVIFNRLSSQFEFSYFLRDNAREDSEQQTPEYFQDKLLLAVSEEDAPNMGILSIRSTFFQQKLRLRKVLIVLDDVKDSQQLGILTRAHDLFGCGSKIIVTTRNMQVLRNIRADQIYEVKKLNQNEANELFHLNAFRTNYPKCADYINLSKRVISYANGNPLALKVLGSFLHSRSKQEWKSALNELKKVPNKDILNVMKISYDGLNENQKEIFLDIACFFEGEDKDYVQKILDGCGFSAEIGISVLIDKYLITIINNKLYMHDLLKEMGREIVRQNSIKEPEKRSRLWIAEDVHRVLKNGTENSAIEGIYLDISKSGELKLRRSAFLRMNNLRLLKFYHSDLNFTESCKVYLPKGLKSLPDALRYLHWESYPLKSLPSKFSPENLIVLNMPYSQVELLWFGVQELRNLKEIDLRYSGKLTQIPDLSLASKLERIKLDGCKSLLEVPSYFQYLDNLKFLSVRFCSNLKHLIELPQNIEHLDLGMTAIEELPSSITYLGKLVTLDLDSFKGHEDNANKRPKQDSFSLFDCSSPGKFPVNIRWLNLSRTTIEVVPSRIGCFVGLESLILSDCRRLKSLSTSICKLKNLRWLDLSGCSSLENFPEILWPMKCLEFLRLDGTMIKELPSSIGFLIGLRKLELRFCNNLELVPNSIYNLRCLEYLYLSGCSKLEKLHPAFVFFSLRELDLSDCCRLELPAPLDCLSSLTYLNLDGNSIESLPESIRQLSQLLYLNLGNCKNLKCIPKLPMFLKTLDAQNCTSLETVSSSRNALLERFHFSNCPNLDQNALRNIMFDAQFSILQMASLAKLGDSNEYDSSGSVCICYSGDKVPKWFNHQTEGSSISIELLPNWFTSNFLGFALCAVVAFDDDEEWYLNDDKDYFCADDYNDFQCESHFRTKYGESHKVDCPLIGRMWKTGRDKGMIQIGNSDHVFQWFECSLNIDGVEGKDESNWSTTFDNIIEAKFEFLVYNNINCNVKKCGIRLLYDEDAEDVLNWDVEEPKVGEGNKTKRHRHEYQSSERVTVNRHDKEEEEEDLVEPHSKRLKEKSTIL